MFDTKACARKNGTDRFKWIVLFQVPGSISSACLRGLRPAALTMISGREPTALHALKMVI